jgi:uncharacterized UPF0146 family protein
LETCRRIEGLADFIAGRYNNTAEIGIGHFPDVAFALLNRGISVFATDIRTFQYHGLHTVVDDITLPDLSLYDGIDLLYSMRPPPEIVTYMERLANKISADLIIKPLSDEYREGWQLMRDGNTTFFFLKFCHLSTFNTINVMPACLESFLGKKEAEKI